MRKKKTEGKKPLAGKTTEKKGEICRNKVILGV
jgi:hypothetical protein